jgi:hypothetical protein
MTKRWISEWKKFLEAEKARIEECKLRTMKP